MSSSLDVRSAGCRRTLTLLLATMLLVLSSVDATARSRRSSRVRRASHAATVSSPREDSSSRANTFAHWTSRASYAEQHLNEQWTVFIQDVATSETIFEYEPSRRLAPASNRKLITMGLALETLGPDFQFQTEFGLTSAPEAGRTHYHGDLILRSNGDPSLTEPFLRNRNPADVFKTWAKALSASGIAYVHGNLIVDASAFGSDQNIYPETWAPSHRNYSYAPVPSALTLCQNLLRVSVAPSSRSGQPCRVSIFPSDEGIEVINNTHTSSRGVRGVTAAFDGEDANRLVLSGSVPARGGLEVATIPLPQPLQYIGAMLKESIEEEGVRQTGDLVIRTASTSSSATAPRALVQRLGFHESPPLAQLLLVMMRRSNNFLAEQLWRAAAARVTGCGDIPNARKIEMDWYRRHDLSWIEPGWDGSGLSRKDQFAAKEMVAITKYLYYTAHRNLMLKVLPTSGRTGTLRHRAGGRLDGRVIAKTGTMAGVSSLTGFITDRQGQARFVFSAIGNAPGSTHGRLSTRINDLLMIAANQLDADIEAGRRPRTLPDAGQVDTSADQEALDSLPDGTSDIHSGEWADEDAPNIDE